MQMIIDRIFTLRRCRSCRPACLRLRRRGRCPEKGRPLWRCYSFANPIPISNLVVATCCTAATPETRIYISSVSHPASLSSPALQSRIYEACSRLLAHLILHTTCLARHRTMLTFRATVLPCRPFVTYFEVGISLVARRRALTQPRRALPSSRASRTAVLHPRPLERLG